MKTKVKAKAKGRPMILPWEKIKAKQWQTFNDKEIQLAFERIGLSCAQPNVFNRRKALILKARLGELDNGAIKVTKETFTCRQDKHSRADESRVQKLVEILSK